MRAAFLLLTIVLWVNEPAYAQARFPFTAEATADRVHVRAGQHNNFESLAVLAKGALVTVLAKQYSWYKVALPQDAGAYVRADYIKVLNADLGEVTADHLNVRALPKTEAAIIGQLKQGQKVFIRESQGKWVEIRPSEGISGWVQEAFLVFKNNGALKTSDPNDAAAQQEAALRRQQEREAVKTAALKKLPDGQVECSGELQSVMGAVPLYRIVLNKTTACAVDGPRAALDPFAGSHVRVTGRIKTIPDTDEPVVVTLLKVRLDL